MRRVEEKWDKSIKSELAATAWRFGKNVLKIRRCSIRAGGEFTHSAKQILFLEALRRIRHFCQIHLFRWQKTQFRLIQFHTLLSLKWLARANWHNLQRRAKKHTFYQTLDFNHATIGQQNGIRGIYSQIPVNLNQNDQWLGQAFSPLYFDPDGSFLIFFRKFFASKDLPTQANQFFFISNFCRPKSADVMELRLPRSYGPNLRFPASAFFLSARKKFAEMSEGAKFDKKVRLSARLVKNDHF